MASTPFITILICLCLHTLTVKCVELNVGGDKGWVTPSSPQDKNFYNHWASNNRFQVNDALRFSYKKDSVMVVTEEEYGKCRSSHPIFFSNKGDTVFTLARPGLFYFISGVSGHCERGLSMIVKVLEPESPPQDSADHNTSAAAAGVGVAAAVFLLPLGVILVV